MFDSAASGLHIAARPNRGSQRALTAVEIAIVALCFVAAALIVGAIFLGRYVPQKRIQQVKQDMRSLQVAISACAGVDCVELYPTRGNYLPGRLTTPQVYIRTLPVDPFSPTGETYRYIAQEGWSHGSASLVASRGPDGDWDIDRLPERRTIHEERWLVGRVRVKTTEYQWPELVLSSPQCFGDVEYYITEDGRRVDVPAYEIIMLPKKQKDGMLGMSEIVRHFLDNSVAIYDPTNGLKSEGDIIRTYPQ